MKKRIIIALLLVAASFALDKYAAILFDAIKLPFIDAAANLVSVTAPIIIVAAPTLFLLKKNSGKLPALYMAIITALALSYFLKFVFRIERPGSVEKTIAFTQLKDYAFPSSHAAMAFAPLHILEKGAFGRVWLAYGLIVAASRVYLGMHNLREVAVGAALGYLAGLYFSENTRLDIKKDVFEVRRQLFHALFGIAIVLLLSKGYINAFLIAIITAAGLLLSLLSKKAELPAIAWFLDRFERKEERKRFPGKGAVLFMFGTLAAVLLFPKDIALAAIMILALGDSFSHITGRFFGRTKQPFSVKLVEGTVAGIIFGFLGAVLFVGTIEAIAAAAIAMTIEAIEIRFRKTVIDDNLLVPLVAGAVIMVIRAFIT